MDELRGLLFGLVVIALATPAAVWAVQFARRRRGGAVVFAGVLLVLGMNMQIVPPPPPVAELVRREAESDED